MTIDRRTSPDAPGTTMVACPIASGATQAAQARRLATASSRMSALAGISLALALFCAPEAMARPSVIDEINDIRADGCDGKRGVKAPLKSSRKLDSVARRIARGEDLSKALSKTGYRALRSSSVLVSNAKSNEEIARTLAKRSCGELRNEAVREIGIEKRGEDIWIVMAQPFGTPELENSTTVSERVLKLANQARSRARRCGSKSLDAVPPLTLTKRLSEAALEHAKDMARNSMLEHKGSDGSTPAVRVTREGYAWRSVGENVASGATTADEVMEGWLASPGHCENLMDPRFSEMGIAYVVDSKSASGVYWAQVFAAPRQ